MGRIKNLIRNLNYLSKHSLWDRREEDIVYLTNKILDDGIYEYGLHVEGKPIFNILGTEGSLALLETSPKSFFRTSDGEIKLMMGMDQPFQRYEKEIADRLIRYLGNPGDKMYAAVSQGYFTPLGQGQYSEFTQNYYRRNAYDFRRFYERCMNPEVQYMNSSFTYYPIGQGRSEKYDRFFARWKALFADKDVVVVCGEGILDKLNYDIFEQAASKRFVYGPRKHAWDAHQRIVDEVVSTVPKDTLVVFILGMAGKAMIPELTDLGYMCWDVGHLAKYYDAYMSQMEGTSENIVNFYAPD